jgi:hypothetical protein
VSLDPGRQAAFATRQRSGFRAGRERGPPVARCPGRPFVTASFLSSRTHGGKPLATDGARCPTPNPTRDGVSHSLQLRE